MANYINIKKIIDVSTTLPAVSQARRDFSNAIFIQQGNGYTNGEVRSYTTAADIALDLGSNSQAYKAALKYFAGGFNGIRPSILYVGLVNTSSVIASAQGYFTSGDVETHLTAFQAVDAGEFKIAFDGATAITITGIDLTTATSLANVATLLQAAISNIGGIKTVKVTYDATAKKFVFTSDTYGTTSAVAITTNTGGTGDDLTGATLLNSGTATAGTTGTQAATIAGFLADTSYYQIMLDVNFTEAQTLEWSSAIEAATKYTYALWVQTNTANVKNESLANDTDTIASNFFNAKKKKTWLVYADTLSDYTQVSFASYFGQVQFTEARPLGCLAFKPFTGAVVSDLTDTNFDNLKAKYVNFYGVYGEPGGNIAYMGTAPNGNFINDIILADWLDYNMTYNIFDWAITKSKIRYTSSDFAEFRQAIERTYMAAVGFGAIAGGTDPDTGETYTNGYKITIPKPSDVSSVDKSQGILTNITTIALTTGNVVKIVITNTLKI
jgi:hypothetical protein